MKKTTLRKLLLLAVILIILFLAGRKIIEYFVQGPEQPQGETDVRFSEIPTQFTHTSDFEAALPFMGLSAIDIDNDGIDEIFAGGGTGQSDAILKFEGDVLINTTYGSGITKADNDPTYGAASIDATADGLPDLFVTRASGLYFYENIGSGFSGGQVDFPLDAQSMPLSVALGDLNKDGAVDLYLSNYIRPEYVEGETIFNDDDYGGVNSLLLNNGDNTFTDITKEAGLYHKHNSFVSVFVDLNDDGHSDLVIAHDTGVPSIYKNNGDLTFDEVDLPVTFSYPMGIAVSDHNNDGLLDLYFSNVGNTLPKALVMGDLREDQTLNTDYILLENQGAFEFKDVAQERNAAVYGFGWGLVSYDFNHDTLADYLISQNYIRFPGVRVPGLFELYTGHLLQQYPDGLYRPVEENAGISNQHFGVNMVVTDLNQDGWPDAVLGNLDSELRAFLNEGGSNNWLKIRLPDEPASIGAILRLETASGKQYVNQFYTSEGLGSDQTNEIFFGLGEESELKSLNIEFQTGASMLYEAPEINTVIVASSGTTE
ncbi:MAG: FG-GAP repeat domain-containing protein [Rhodothermales bacterium]